MCELLCALDLSNSPVANLTKFSLGEREYTMQYTVEREEEDILIWIMKNNYFSAEIEMGKVRIGNGAGRELR